MRSLNIPYGRLLRADCIPFAGIIQIRFSGIISAAIAAPRCVISKERNFKGIMITISANKFPFKKCDGLLFVSGPLSQLEILNLRDMIVKLFKAVWFVSLMLVTAVLLYCYASLPNPVMIWEKGISPYYISSDSFFYYAVAFIAILNVLVFIKTGMQNPIFKSWFLGLIITFNVFICITIGFLSLFNSTEHYDFSKITVIIYGSVVLIAGWALFWPIYRAYTGIFSRS